MRSHLFTKNNWSNIPRNQQTKMSAEIEGYDTNMLLNTPTEDLVEYFVSLSSVDVPFLHEDAIHVSQSEAQIDVRHDRMRMIRDRSKPALVSGTQVNVVIPFTGEAILFTVQPTSFSLNPPNAMVEGSNLLVTIQGIGLESSKVKAEIDSTIKSINSNLEILRRDAEVLNESLPSLARAKIEARKTKLLENQSLVASLGYGLTPRHDTPHTTYKSNVAKRKAPIRKPVASNKPYEPEPELDYKEYQHILNVIDNMTQVIEQSPKAFSTMDEEALRTHYLVQLNGHYEGHATGETFNYQGKTDILIRDKGKNIFIAECKFWSGKKGLSDTIDQLLGYSSWRDTKVAIILFNRNKDFGRVLETIPGAMESNSNYKRTVGLKGESSFEYIFGSISDINRELTLTVKAFDVPTV